MNSPEPAQCEGLSLSFRGCGRKFSSGHLSVLSLERSSGQTVAVMPGSQPHVDRQVTSRRSTICGSTARLRSKSEHFLGFEPSICSLIPAQHKSGRSGNFALQKMQAICNASTHTLTDAHDHFSQNNLYAHTERCKVPGCEKNYTHREDTSPKPGRHEEYEHDVQKTCYHDDTKTHVIKTQYMP